jgi:hypothetical protein
MQYPLIFIKLLVSVPICRISLGYSRNGTIRWSRRDLSSCDLMILVDYDACVWARKKGRRERREMLREEPFRRALRALSTSWRNSVWYRLQQRVVWIRTTSNPAAMAADVGRRLPIEVWEWTRPSRPVHPTHIYDALRDTSSTCLPRFSVAMPGFRSLETLTKVDVES